MVVQGRQSGIEKLVLQLNKLVFVQSITDLTELPFVQRELMLVKVGFRVQVSGVEVVGAGERVCLKVCC
jgi:acetolactate synthase small subunit